MESSRSPFEDEAEQHQWLSGQKALLTGALEHLAIGVVVTDCASGGLTMNGAARKLLESPVWSSPAHVGLPPRRSSERLPLRQFIDQAVRSNDGRAHAFTLVSASMQQRLHIFTEPLAEGGMAFFLCDPHRAVEPSEDILRELYQFTAAEAKLVCELVNGHTVEEAAERLGIKLNTARSHLKKIFAKTHTQRQGEMVRLLTTSVAAIDLSN